MKVTAKNIRGLGFDLIVNGIMEDYTFNRRSITRKDWYDVIVWQPRTNEIALSTHSIELAHVFNNGMPKGKKLEDYIRQVKVMQNVESFNELCYALSEVGFI